MALYNISTYSQYTEVLIGFMLCHTTSIFRQIAQIEHFSYAYSRVLFLACDGRRRGDPNDSSHYHVFIRFKWTLPHSISSYTHYVYF